MRNSRAIIMSEDPGHWQVRFCCSASIWGHEHRAEWHAGPKQMVPGLCAALAR